MGGVRVGKVFRTNWGFGVTTEGETEPEKVWYHVKHKDQEFKKMREKSHKENTAEFLVKVFVFGLQHKCSLRTGIRKGGNVENNNDQNTQPSEVNGSGTNVTAHPHTYDTSQYYRNCCGGWTRG